MQIHQAIDQVLKTAQVAIANATANPTVEAALADYGYTSERLQAGWELYQRAVAAKQQQKREYGKQIAATDAMNQQWQTAQTTYMRFVKVARIAFKSNPGLFTALDLNGRRKRTLSAWIFQAQQFYVNALSNPEVLQGLANYGITHAKLAAGQAEVQALETASQLQNQERGEAQNATKERDAAIKALNDWLRDFIAIARVALDEHPQLLETLGIVVES